MAKHSRAAAKPYLWFRPESRFIWFRMAVPKSLRDRVGKSIIAVSLGTADTREAAILAGKLRADLFEQWGGLTPPRTPANDDLESIAVQIGHDNILEYEDRRREGLRGGNAQDFWRLLERNRINLETQQFAAVTGDDGPVRALANAAIEEMGLDLPPDSDGYATFCRYLNTARLAALQASERRIRGDLDALADSALVERVRERERNTAKTGETIEELFDRWTADAVAKGEKRPGTVEQDRKVIRQFASFIGVSRSIDSITPVEVAEYRDLLRDLPPKWNVSNQLAGLTMRQAAEKARALGLAQTAFTTVNKHLSTISPLYRWLAAQPKWAGLRNPCDGLFHIKVKGKNCRPSFSTDDLNRILRSPLFTGFLSKGKEHKPGKVQADDWRKWVPLVCMMTGARISEIAQLRVGDVRQERGVWFIHIRHNEASGQATKSGKSRTTAIHSKLEEIGFLAFHARRADSAAGEDAPLFPELWGSDARYIGDMPSRWWRDYLKAIKIKSGSDGFGVHSFRHTLADRLRFEAELMDNQIEVILGHNQKTTTGGYGQLSQGTVTMLKGWIEGVRFEGVDFGTLAPVSAANHTMP